MNIYSPAGLPPRRGGRSARRRTLRRRRLWLAASISLFFGLFAIGLLVVKWRENVEAERQIRSKIPMVGRLLPSIFAKFIYRQPASSEVGREMVWRGDHSELLISYHVVVEAALMQRPRAFWTVLARTKSGRFFEVVYVLDAGEDCSVKTSCLTVIRFAPLKPQAVKELLIRWRQIQLYERLFNEPMFPPDLIA